MFSENHLSCVFCVNAYTIDTHKRHDSLRHFMKFHVAFLLRSVWLVFCFDRWIIDPPLEVTVPSKRTPWPDAPPELPSHENVVAQSIQEHTVKHSTKTRSPRSKRRSKRKHDARVVDTQAGAKHSEQNWLNSTFTRSRSRYIHQCAFKAWLSGVKSNSLWGGRESNGP